jgi:hypothetical protein
MFYNTGLKTFSATHSLIDKKISGFKKSKEVKEKEDGAMNIPEAPG